MKLCVGASAGGHMDQIVGLLQFSSLWSSEPITFVTTQRTAVAALRVTKKAYVIGDANRRRPLRAIGVLVLSLVTAIRLHPRLVITTGAMPLAVFSIIAWCLGGRIVWVDSIANVDRLSLSGRLIRPFAIAVFTQWADLEDRKRRIIYAGEVM